MHGSAGPISRAPPAAPAASGSAARGARRSCRRRGCWRHSADSRASMSRIADSFASSSATVPSLTTTYVARCAFSCWVSWRAARPRAPRGRGRRRARARTASSAITAIVASKPWLDPGLEQQRHLDHRGPGRRTRRSSCARQSRHPLPDPRPQQPLQPRALLVGGERAPGQRRAVDHAVGRDRAPKRSRRPRRAPRRSRTARGRPGRSTARPRPAARAPSSAVDLPAPMPPVSPTNGIARSRSDACRGL